MALSRFRPAAFRAVEATIAVADLCRQVRDDTGDLTFELLGRLHNAIRVAKAANLEALTEGAQSRADADVLIGALGGPATLAEYDTQIKAFEAAVAGWTAALSAALASMDNGELVSVSDQVRAGIGVPQVAFAEAIPAQAANTLRAGAGLADLIAALEAAGA